MAFLGPFWRDNGTGWSRVAFLGHIWRELSRQMGPMNATVDQPVQFSRQLGSRNCDAPSLACLDASLRGPNPNLGLRVVQGLVEFIVHLVQEPQHIEPKLSIDTFHTRLSEGLPHHLHRWAS